MHLDNFRHNRFSTVLAQWLTAMFLLQIALPIQAHSRLVTKDNGITVVMCTLQGEHTVTLDLSDDNQVGNTQFSAAMLFSDLLAGTTPLLATLKVPSLLLGISQIVSISQPNCLSVSEIDACSRAPPSV